MSSNSTAKKFNNINNSENYIKNFKITVFNSSKFKCYNFFRSIQTLLIFLYKRHTPEMFIKNLK